MVVAPILWRWLDKPGNDACDDLLFGSYSLTQLLTCFHSITLEVQSE
jgi:hypothetical protein